jgi:preprotein translocase subunit YajC
MFDTAYAQTAGAAADSGLQGFLSGPMGSIVFFLPIIVLFYFLIFRPQQQRAKQHASMVGGLKRGDSVVLNSGVIGKVVRVEDKEIGLEIATGVTVKVVKGMIADVRARGEPAAANDTKA